MACKAVHKAAVGRREYWLSCMYEPRHQGGHKDAKRGITWHESFYWGDWEVGAKAKESSLPMKFQRCQTCMKRKQGPYWVDVCQCWRNHALGHKDQADWIKVQQVIAEEEREMQEMDDYIAKHWEQGKAQWALIRYENYDREW